MKIDHETGEVLYPSIRVLRYRKNNVLIACRLEFYPDGEVVFTRDVLELPPQPSKRALHGPAGGSALERIEAAIRAQSRS